MVLTEQNIIRLSMLFASLLVTNFLTIHLMSNLILYKGVSRRKSARLSAEFASLTTTLVLCIVVGYNLIEPSFEITPLYIIAVIIGGEGLFVGLVKWWYIHRELETTWLEAFIISEWLKITLSILLTMTLTLFPGLV